MRENNPFCFSEWKPEDKTVWNATGKLVARCNLIWSIVAENVAFSVWLIRSIVATKLPEVGYRMIPSAFCVQNLSKAKGTGEVCRALALETARIESGAAVGFVAAIAACGGYLTPSGFGPSIAAISDPQLALEIYLAFYATCLAITWWFYSRTKLAEAGASSLAIARI
jgi:NNP family nitrate/nitrite transporter-like MFS transporter